MSATVHFSIPFCGIERQPSAIELAQSLLEGSDLLSGYNEIAEIAEELEHFSDRKEVADWLHSVLSQELKCGEGIILILQALKRIPEKERRQAMECTRRLIAAQNPAATSALIIIQAIQTVSPTDRERLIEAFISFSQKNDQTNFSDMQVIQSITSSDPEKITRAFYCLTQQSERENIIAVYKLLQEIPEFGTLLAKAKIGSADSKLFLDVMINLPPNERKELIGFAKSLSNEKMDLHEVRLIMQALAAIPSKDRLTIVNSILAKVDIQNADSMEIRRLLGAISPRSKLSTEKQWEEFTRRARGNPDEYAKLMEGVNSITEEQISQLVEALQTGNLNAEILNRPEDSHLITLRALREGRISSFQAASLLVSLGFLERQLERLPLFDAEGRINERAYRILRGSFLMGTYQNGTIIDDARFNSFLENLQKEARKQGFSEYWIAIADPSDDHLRNQPSDTNIYVREMYAAIRLRHGAFVHLTEDRGSSKNCYSSLAIQQAYLDLHYPYPVGLHPVIGLSSVEDISNNGRNGSRDVAIRVPGIFLPQEADLIPAPAEQFTYHDYFHAHFASHTPPRHREQFYVLPMFSEIL